MRFALPVLAATLLAAVPSHAQDELLDYEGAMQCGAVYTFLGAVNEGEEGADFVLDLEEQGQRWLIMAMARDGHDGTQALSEFEPVTEALMAKLETLEEDQIEPFLLDHIERCEGFERAHSDEFSAIDMED